MTDPGDHGWLLELVEDCTTWSLSTYWQCDFRCVYCITQAQGKSTPKFPASRLVSQLRSELEAVPMEDGITIGSMSDAYPLVEEAYGVTRLAIEELTAQGRRFNIVTKGRTVVRDIDLLCRHGPLCGVQVSLCTVDDAVLRRLDPVGPSVDERLSTVRALASAGIRVSISATPWIPGFSNARQMIARVPLGIPIQFGPLNVQGPWGKGPILGRFTQQEINERYLHEREAVGSRPGVHWLYPVRCEDDDSPRRHPFELMRE